MKPRRVRGSSPEAADEAARVRRETRADRLLALAFARGGWRDDGLVAIAKAWLAGAEALGADALGARVALEGLRRALATGAGLHQQLLGAAAMPGWSDAQLTPVVRLTINYAPNFEADEIRALRAWAKGRA